MSKEKKFMYIGIFILLITLVGASSTYAWFTWSSTNNTSITMSIGESSEVVFASGNDITTSSLAPVFNYTDGEDTSFKIVNKGSTSIDYKVILNITSIDNELKSDSLKYVLVKDNTIIKEDSFTNITTGNTTLYESSITNSSNNFIFYLYIDGNMENDLSMMNKNITGTITVEASLPGVNNLATYITNLYTNSTKSTTEVNSITYNLASSVSLMNDRYGSMSTNIDSGNIRYYGASPNNYIYFNCDDYSNQSSTTCELWRIIGIFDGKVKIMRNETIGYYSWDNKNPSTGAENSDGKNDWTRARLMKLLNPSSAYTVDSRDNGYGQSLYWNGESGTCFRGQNNDIIACNFTSTGLKNAVTRNLISESTWSIRGHNTNQVYVDQIYEKEKTSGTVYSGRPTSWTGYVALAYPSDYGYSVDLSQCKDTDGNAYMLDSYSQNVCKNNNWMWSVSPRYTWLLTPYSDYSHLVWRVHSYGHVIQNHAKNAWEVVPVLYLNSDQRIEGGNIGSSDDPYRLVVSS